MISQLRQKLPQIFLQQKELLQAHRIYYNFSNESKKTESNLLNQKIDFKSLTKVEIAQYLRQVQQECNFVDANKQGLANRLNNIEQQATSHLSLNQDDLTNLTLILQIMVQNKRNSQNILQVAHTILIEYFSAKTNLQLLSQEKLLNKIQVFQQLIPLVTQTDRFSYELLKNMYLFFENKLVFNQFTEASKLSILKIFFQKGIVSIPSHFQMDIQKLSFKDLVELIWMQTLSNIPIEPSSIQLLQTFILNQPSLKNIPKPIQFKLKEISISQKLGDVNKYISQLDDFYTQETDTSLIQEDCEIILKVLKWNFKSEFLIDPYTVDFVLDIPNIKKKVVLEMNGPSHYPYFTKTEILSAKDQMKVKNLLLKDYYPILLHHQQWSAIKGVTGKMEFIENNVKNQIKQYV